MKETQTYKSAELMRVLDAQPHELRAWLRLDPLASREKKRRSATAYTPLDVLFLAVVKQLDTAGFSPKALKAFSASLYKAIQRPAAGAETGELALYLKDDGPWRIGTPPEGVDAMELRIPLRSIRLHLLRYTGAHIIAAQTEMGLLALVENRDSHSFSEACGGRRASR